MSSQNFVIAALKDLFNNYHCRQNYVGKVRIRHVFPPVGAETCCIQFRTCILQTSPKLLRMKMTVERYILRTFKSLNITLTLNCGGGSYSNVLVLND